MAQRVLIMISDRRQGKTTALLDIAISNARRGEQVMFWTESYSIADHAFCLAEKLLYEQRDPEVVVAQCNHQLRWPKTERGSVTFGYPEARLSVRGFRATVVVNDCARMPAPEPMHAHTVIDGG